MDEKEKIEEIKNNLTLEQIEGLLIEFGGEPHRQGNIIISKTVCHCGESHKLFYYDNTKLFRCYTECSDTFDIFQLVIKIQNILGNKIALPQAITYIINFFNLDNFTENFEYNKLDDWKLLKTYNKNNKEKHKQIVELKHYDKQILKYLPMPRILCWEEEGITKEAIMHHGIRYNPISQAIVIPHHDKDGNLITEANEKGYYITVSEKDIDTSKQKIEIHDGSNIWLDNVNGGSLNYWDIGKEGTLSIIGEVSLDGTISSFSKIQGIGDDAILHCQTLGNLIFEGKVSNLIIHSEKIYNVNIFENCKVYTDEILIQNLVPESVKFMIFNNQSM